MTEERSLDELGPVDYLIVEFPAGQQNFTGDGVRELVSSTNRGIIRVMDILILQKADDGTVMAQELGDLGHRRAGRPRGAARADAGRGRRREPGRRDGPGSVAGVLVYEYTWAAVRIGDAPGRRPADRQRPAPIQALIAAVEADAVLESQGV